MSESNNAGNTYDIEKPYVIVCEGIDDENFLRMYLKYLSRHGFVNQSEYNIWKVDGLDNMKSEMKNYKKYDGYSYMKSFLFVCDADDDAEAAISSLIDHINRTWHVTLNRHGDFIEDELGVKVGFYIMPGIDETDCYRNGALEDLCMDLLNTDKEFHTDYLLDEIGSYMERLRRGRKREWKHPHKNRLYLALSSTDSFVGDKLGQAAVKGAFDFSRKALEKLKVKITNMHETELGLETFRC